MLNEKIWEMRLVPDIDPGNLIIVGVIKGAHGVRGDVRVKSFTDDPASILSFGPLYDADGNFLLTPQSSRPAKDHFIVAAAPQRTKEDWDALKGALLHIPRADLPEIGDGEFYVSDLIGMKVVDDTGAVVGQVRAVQNFGADDLLEIALSGVPSSIFVPFTAEEVTDVDIGKERIAVPRIAEWADPAEK